MKINELNAISGVINESVIQVKVGRLVGATKVFLVSFISDLAGLNMLDRITVYQSWPELLEWHRHDP